MSDETIAETDCILCRHFNPTQRLAMRAKLIVILSANPSAGFRACVGILRLAKTYGPHATLAGQFTVGDLTFLAGSRPRQAARSGRARPFNPRMNYPI
jgi:hypothetical protein